MSRSIDDVKAVILPEAGNSGRLNGNTTFCLLFHEVCGGLAIVYFTGFVNHAGQLQDTFGCSGLTGVNVSEDADVSVFG